MRDPYAILGVARTATPDDLKKAYRRLAKELHPDLNPEKAGNDRAFKDVTAAYDFLSDPKRRARYDRGEIDASGVDAHPRPRSRGPRGRAGAADHDDPLGDLFARRREWSQGRGAAGPASADRPAAGSADKGDSARAANGSGTGEARGRDLTYSLTIPFLEAAAGGKRRIALSTGKSLDVTIPPGTVDQQKLRLKGQGLPAVGGGAPGDAIVEVWVEPHPHLNRQGSDILIEVPVSISEAMLGANIRVPTVDGPVTVKVPPGSNTGSRLRLRGKGVVDQTTRQIGDQYVTLRVVLPDPPDPELVALVERWSQTASYNPRKKAGLE